MNRSFVLTAALCCAIFASTSATGADDKGGVKTGAIMKKCFGKNGLCGATIGQGKKMDWDAAAKTVKEFYTCIEQLPKGAPKKGDKEDFVEAAKTFVGKVKDLKSAVDDKDTKKFDAATKGITGSCKGCHTAHR
ncbi:MAG: cytochrome c [Gemmataceae bacterium]